jgi:hypothetical protein
MVLVDTDVLIDALNGRDEAISLLKKIGYENLIISSITLMEVYQGAINKSQLIKLKKNLAYYDVLHLDFLISQKAIELVGEFKLSHGLSMPDALIAASAITHNIPLCTYNIQDFKFIKELILFKT